MQYALVVNGDIVRYYEYSGDAEWAAELAGGFVIPVCQS